MPELLELLAGQVELHVPEPVDVQAAGADPAGRSTSGCGTSSRTSELGSTGGPSFVESEPEREVRRRRREDVSAVEGRRDGLERVLAVGQLVGGVDPAELLGRRDQQAVVGADVEAAVAAAERDAHAGRRPRPDRRPRGGRLGEVRERVREHERALQHALRRDPVRDVDDLDLGRDPLHHAVAGADEVVLEPEVGEEGDRSRSGATLTDCTAATRPSRSCVSASASDRSPAARAASLVWGPIETAGMSAPSSANARAAEPEASTTRSPSGGASGRRAACGRAGRSRRRARRRPPPGTLGSGEEHAARGAGNSASSPSCDETAGTKAGSTPCSRSVSAVPGPTAATSRQLAARARERAPGRRSGS